MTKTVFIGSTSMSSENLERVAEGIGADIGIDYLDGMTNPSKLYSDVFNARVVTQSLGFMTLYGANPKEVSAFAPPLPSTRARYVVGGIAKALQYYTSTDLYSDIPTAKNILRDNAKTLELWSANQRERNRYFADGSVTSFSAIDLGKLLVSKGTRVDLIYGEYDTFYRPSEEQLQEANHANVNIAIIPNMVHDALILDPVRTINDAEKTLYENIYY